MHSALRPFPLGQGGWALYGNFVRDQHEKVLPLSAGKGDCQSEETTTVATWPHRRSSRATRPRLLLQSLHTVRIMVRDGAGVRARVRVGAGVGVGPDKCAPPRLRAARAGGTRVPPPSALLHSTHLSEVARQNRNRGEKTAVRENPPWLHTCACTCACACVCVHVHVRGSRRRAYINSTEYGIESE